MVFLGLKAGFRGIPGVGGYHFWGGGSITRNAGAYRVHLQTERGFIYRVSRLNAVYGF